MSRLLLIFLLVVIILALVFGGFWFINKDKKADVVDGDEEEEETLKKLALEDKPYLSFSPGTSCEYELSVSNIKGDPAKVEYEIVYKDEAGITQGASGSITPTGSSTTKKVLFGTESSGNRKCDKGVEGGDITIKYRNDGGKLTAKLTSEFAVVEGGTKLALGNKFALTLSKTSKDKFVVVETFGLPKAPDGTVSAGPVGVFTSGKSALLSGTVELEGEGTLQVWNGTKWTSLADGKTSTLGTFIKTQ